MAAEGLGRGLLLTPLGTPPKVPKKQTVGTVTASHKMLTLRALSSSLHAGTAKRGFFQKNPRVRKIRVRNSGAGNGCANFMDTRKKCVLSAGKTMSIKFLVLGGGYFGFYFYGRADFSEAFWAKERLLGDLRQPVPQNGRVHLLGIDLSGTGDSRGSIRADHSQLQPLFL